MTEQEAPRGIVENMPEADYHAAPGLSASLIWAMASKPPARVRYELDHPKEESPALALGTVTHCAILEPDRLEQDFVVLEKPNLRTKAGKAEWQAMHEGAAAAGQTIVTQAEFDKARGMRDAVHAHPVARAALSGGRGEVSLFVDDDEHGLLRSREDWMPDGYNVVCDLKTARDAGKWFGNDAFRLGYHAKAHHYRHVRHLLNQSLGGDTDWPDYLWLVVEPDPPHLCAVYRPDPDMEMLGEMDWRAGAQAYTECRRAGTWPGLDTDIMELSPPRWSLRRLDEFSAMGIDV